MLVFKKHGFHCLFLLLTTAVAIAVFVFDSPTLPTESSTERVAGEVKGEEEGGYSKPDGGRSKQDADYSSPDSSVGRAEDETLFGRFDSWLDEFEHAPPAHREALIARGVALASERRRVVAALIEHDPEKALSRAVPRHLYRELPEQITRYLETPIDAIGDFLVTLACHSGSANDCFHGAAGNPTADEKLPVPGHVRRTVRIDGEYYRAFGPADSDSTASRYNVEVRGIALAEAMAMAPEAAPRGGEMAPRHDFYQRYCTASPSPGDAWAALMPKGKPDARYARYAPGADTAVSLAGEEQGSEHAWTLGTKRLLFIRVIFSDYRYLDGTTDSLEREMAEVASFLHNNSRGRYNLEFEVIPEVFELPREAYTYSNYEIFRTVARNRAREYDEAHGATGRFDPDNFDLDILYFPSNPYFPTANARVGGPGIWLNGFAGHQLILHEIGHNLGLRHANHWRPHTEDPVGTGSHVEYGDLFDSMGRFPHREYHYNPSFKSFLGWLSDEDILEVHESGIYRFHRHDTGENQPRAIVFSRAGRETYWLSLCVDSLEKEGIGIRWGYEPGEAGPFGTRLLNMRPASSIGVFDYPLRQEEVFYDPVRRLTVRLLALGGEHPNEYAEVEILIETPPSITAQPVGTRTFAGETLALSVEADGPPPLSYQWLKDGVAIPGANEATLTVQSLATTDRGAYTVEVSNPFDTVLSDPADVIVFPAGYRIPGTLDPRFDPGEGGFAIGPVALQADGMLLLGGAIRSYDGMEVDGLARIHPDGRLDPSFLPRLTPPPRYSPSAPAIAIQPDSRILIGGTFTHVNGTLRSGLARLHPSGELDFSFDAGSGPSHPPRSGLSLVARFIVMDDGKILAQGNFTRFDGQPAPGLVRLLPDGRLDSTFQALPGAERSEVWGAHLKRNGELIVTGSIATADGETFVARLLENGQLDPSFPIRDYLNLQARFGGTRFGEQSDGSLIIAGEIRSDEVSYRKLFRLAPDGRLDTSFPPDPDLGTVYTIAIVDDRILLAGNFSAIQGQSTNRIARLDRNGYLDLTFTPWSGPTLELDSIVAGSIHNIFPLPDETYLITGTFSHFDDVPRRGIARIYGDMTDNFFHNWAVHRGLPVGEESLRDDPGGFIIPNLLRYAFLLDPHRPKREDLPTLSRQEDGSLRLTFRRSSRAEDLEYVVEHSPDLLSWAPLEGVEMTIREETATWEKVSLQVAASEENERLFLRVRVTHRD